jgi:hypothetical protein
MHQQWLDLPIVKLAELVESNNVQQGQSPVTSQFLHYGCIFLRNRLFGYLLNQWRGIKIYISFIRLPQMGPGPAVSERIPTAIEICRTAAAIYGPSTALWNLVPLGFAGASFGGDKGYPLETKWVLKKLAECGMRDLPTMFQFYEHLWKVWSSRGSFLEGMKILNGGSDCYSP